MQRSWASVSSNVYESPVILSLWFQASFATMSFSSNFLLVAMILVHLCLANHVGESTGMVQVNKFTPLVYLWSSTLSWASLETKPGKNDKPANQKTATSASKPDGSHQPSKTKSNGSEFFFAAELTSASSVGPNFTHPLTIPVEGVDRINKSCPHIFQSGKRYYFWTEALQPKFLPSTWTPDGNCSIPNHDPSPPSPPTCELNFSGNNSKSAPVIQRKDCNTYVSYILDLHQRSYRWTGLIIVSAFTLLADAENPDMITSDTKEKTASSGTCTVRHPHFGSLILLLRSFADQSPVSSRSPCLAQRSRWMCKWFRADVFFCLVHISRNHLTNLDILLSRSTARLLHDIGTIPVGGFQSLIETCVKDGQVCTQPKFVMVDERFLLTFIFFVLVWQYRCQRWLLSCDYTKVRIIDREPTGYLARSSLRPMHDRSSNKIKDE